MDQAIFDTVDAFRRSVRTVVGSELCFPTSLDASRRVFQALENPDIGLASLAKVVVAEPLLSARVIRLANSVAMNPGGQVVRDVRQAVLALLAGKLGYDPDVRCTHHDEAHGEGSHTCGSHGCGNHSCH